VRHKCSQSGAISIGAQNLEPPKKETTEQFAQEARRDCSIASRPPRALLKSPITQSAVRISDCIGS